MSAFTSVLEIFSNQAIAKNGSASKVVDLSRFNTDGFFSLQITLTGDGNVDVIWAMSNNGDDYITPTGTTKIYTAFAKTSGPSSDGKSIASFDPVLGKFLKIIATEQNANPVVVNAWLALQ